MSVFLTATLHEGAGYRRFESCRPDLEDTQEPSCRQGKDLGKTRPDAVIRRSSQHVRRVTDTMSAAWWKSTSQSEPLLDMNDMRSAAGSEIPV